MDPRQIITTAAYLSLIGLGWWVLIHGITWYVAVAAALWLVIGTVAAIDPDEWTR